MTESLLSRRRFLTAASRAVAAAPLLAACGAAASTERAATPGLAKPAVSLSSPVATQPAAATVPPRQGPAGSVATAQPQAIAQPTAAAGARTALSLTVRTEPEYGWHERQAKSYADAHPEISLTVLQVAYGDMAQKQLQMLATGTMPVSSG